MLVIFLVVLYASRLIADGSYLKRLPMLALSAVTVLLIDGFFLLRTGLSLLGEKTTEGADYGFYRRFPLNQLFAGMFSGCARNDLKPLIYCSVAAFFFAARGRDVAPVAGFPRQVGQTLDRAVRRARGAGAGEFRKTPVRRDAAPDSEAAVFRVAPE